MPKPRLTKEQTREKILQKADELFRQYGFGKTNVADIAAGLGMSPANIYKFFPSKKAILEASAVRNFSMVQSQIAEIMGRESSAAARLRAVVLAGHRFHRDLFRNERQIFLLVMTAVEEAWPCVFRHHEFLLETFTRLVREGVEGGEFRADLPPQTTQALLDCLSAALRPHLQVAGPTPDEPRVEAQLALLIRSLQAFEPPQNGCPGAPTP